ncbi:MAG: RNA polymerase sigma factor [Acidobacteria bacterium]|nr:RNA polymerase sigma factor [Acidobacteriota bacterium]
MNPAIHQNDATSSQSTEPDAALLARLAGGDHGAFETLMRRHNQRLFRTARAIVKDDADAEEVLQDAYIEAYRHADGFRGDARVSTWLTRIVVNTALMRLRKQRTHPVLVPFTPATPEGRAGDTSAMTSAAEASDGYVLRTEIRRLLERRIDELPATFRAVFVMRDVEEMTSQEVADALSLPVGTVRTRLFRARALLRAALERDMDVASAGIFGFAGARCDRIVVTVLARLASDAAQGSESSAPDNAR